MFWMIETILDKFSVFDHEKSTVFSAFHRQTPMCFARKSSILRSSRNFFREDNVYIAIHLDGWRSSSRTVKGMFIQCREEDNEEIEKSSFQMLIGITSD